MFKPTDMEKPDGPDERSRGMLQELTEAQERIVRGELYPNYQEALAFLGKAKEALRFASYVLDMKERKIPPEPDPQPKKRKKDQPKKQA